MMDDAFDCEHQNGDQTDAPHVDEECDVDMEEMLQMHHMWTRNVMLIWKKCCATLNQRCC
jgi:hypothetical protein